MNKLVKAAGTALLVGLAAACSQNKKDIIIDKLTAELDSTKRILSCNVPGLKEGRTACDRELIILALENQNEFLWSVLDSYKSLIEIQEAQNERSREMSDLDKDISELKYDIAIRKQEFEQKYGSGEWEKAFKEWEKGFKELETYLKAKEDSLKVQ